MMKSKLYFVALICFFAFSVLADDMQSAIDALNAKNYNQAFQEFMIEAKGGNADAMNYVGNMYAGGYGTKQNYQKAIYWYKEAIKKNNSEAYNNLATMYESGKGVKQDYNKAVTLFNKAISMKVYLANYNLSIMYESGKGVKRDYNKAVALLTDAAQGNVVYAKAILGTIYYVGALGQKINLTKAFNYTSEAAKSGLPGAQMSLGTLYMQGKAVKQNYLDAYKWYYIAYRNGEKKAYKGLEQVSPYLTKQQMDRVKLLSDEWLKEHDTINPKYSTVTNGYLSLR